MRLGTIAYQLIPHCYRNVGINLVSYNSPSWFYVYEEKATFNLFTSKELDKTMVSKTEESTQAKLQRQLPISVLKASKAAPLTNG